MDVQRPPRFTDADAALLENCRRGEETRGIRTRQWLEWRLGPTNPHDTVAIRAMRGDTLVGLLVAKHHAPAATVDILEIAAIDRGEVVEALLRTAVAVWADTQPQALEMWSLQRYSPTTQLQRLGFVGGGRYTAMITRFPTASTAEEDGSWLLTFADSDVY